MICKRCDGQCRENISETEFVEIECPSCGGYGCEHCDEGFFKLTQCAKQFVDDALIEAVNACSFADKGFLPATGAMLDQANWFCELWVAVGNEQIAIDNERLEKLERRL